MLEPFLLVVLITAGQANFPNMRETHSSYIIVNQCLQQFPLGPSASYALYTILSFCHLSPAGRTLLWQFDTIIAKPLPRYATHSFKIKFEDITDPADAVLFQPFYERLYVPASHRLLFEHNGQYFRGMTGFNPSALQRERLLSRWNLDEITLLNSIAALHLVAFNEFQLPTSLQKRDWRYRSNNVSDLSLTYYISSGYRHRCVHHSRNEKLALLTLDFTAYDRLYCDAVEYHGLQNSFTGYWNTHDMFYFRGRLIRDGLMSVFPPDTSHAVYFSSPQITFTVLQRPPVTSAFVVRPFNELVWLSIIGLLLILEGSPHLPQMLDALHNWIVQRQLVKEGKSAIIVFEDRDRLKRLEARYLNVLTTYKETLAYGGMVLVGILNPLSPWIPKTFKELNMTENYFIRFAKHSPSYFFNDHLVEFCILNGVNPGMIKNRVRETPAEFLGYSESAEFTGQGDNKDKFYAAVMYDDKRNFWMKGRAFIERTAGFLGRITASEDKVLSEIRYFSVAPGATRLHFLMVTMKRAFTAGTWMRWYYLEKNYYAKVAPIVARKIVQGRSVPTPVMYEGEGRPLNMQDLCSAFIFKGVSLVLGFILFLNEWHTNYV